ncbi:MAG: hypothetical protein ABSE49_23490 [Polyangiaceae bacterium]
MMNHRKNSPQALRFAERRKREDEAPRLHDQVPGLTSLRLEIEDRVGVGGATHTRQVLIDRAPALFLIQCGDPRCIDGEHDLTTGVMRALRYRETSFNGEDECRGSVGSSACSRVLHYSAKAVYDPEVPRPETSARYG